jgi:hypothetical protein
MILVKRDGLNSSLAAREYRSVFPEGTMYQQNLIRGGKLNKQQTTAELFRKLKEDPGCKRARMLLDQLNGL